MTVQFTAPVRPSKDSNPSPNAIPLPTRISRYRLSPQEVPVDFFADPDGQWEFSTLVEMAGFNPEHPGASVGALREAFDGYPEGSAVIAEVGTESLYVAIAQLPQVQNVVSSAASPRLPAVGNSERTRNKGLLTGSGSRSYRAA
jgi:hypothetical protein